MNVLTRGSVESTVASHTEWLNKALKESEGDTSRELDRIHLGGRWTGLRQADELNLTQWDTGVELELLKFVGERSVQAPADFVRTLYSLLFENYLYRRGNIALFL